MSKLNLDDVLIKKTLLKEERDAVLTKWLGLMYETYTHKKIVTKKYKSIGDKFVDVSIYFTKKEYYIIDPYKIQIGKKILHQGRVVQVDTENLFTFLKKKFKTDEWVDYIFMPLEENSDIIFCNEEGSFFITET